MAIEHADFDGVERLALVTGGEIASTFGNTEAVTLGTCKLIEEVMIGEEKMIKFSGCAKGEACTIVLRGATQQIVDEAERALHDVLCVLIATIKNDGCVYGGKKKKRPLGGRDLVGTQGGGRCQNTSTVRKLM